MRLKDKVAIVTGGASGFGEGIVRKFVDEGARVVIADVAGDKANSVASSLGAQARAIATDVTDDGAVRALVETTIKEWGGLDILVNNAGMGHLPQNLEDLDPVLFDKLFTLNVKSLLLTARHAVPHFKQRKAGAILNIASTAGVSPRPRLTWYNASKGAVITATRSMAVELAPYRVRVNALNPVAGETPMLATFMGEDTPEIRAKFLATIPLGRFSTPRDMGNAACFLCSDEADMITGVAMEVDGGRCV